jgi:hypothetical protein
MYICAGKRFLTLKGATDYANRLFRQTGVIAGIEQVN